MPRTILEVRHLVKHFPGVKAVDDISFAIAEGACLGLLGPNGAGKTTTIEIMEGILPATRGEVLYKGEPIGAQFLEKCCAVYTGLTFPKVCTIFTVWHSATAFVCIQQRLQRTNCTNHHLGERRQII